MFADPDNEGEWLVGIAYKDEIICACCGGVFEVADVLEAVPEGEQAIYPYEDWADISTEICGDCFPEGFTALDAADEDIYFDEDYDWERYRNDEDYARGVDDAMEDEDW